jgi:hypothetical protein
LLRAGSVQSRALKKRITFLMWRKPSELNLFGEAQPYAGGVGTMRAGAFVRGGP